MDHIDTIWDQFGPYWNILDYLNYFGQLLNSLNYIGSIWTILNYFELLEPCWTIWDNFGPFCTIIIHIITLLAISNFLDNCGLLMNFFDNFCHLDYFGSFWTNWIHFGPVFSLEKYYLREIQLFVLGNMQLSLWWHPYYHRIVWDHFELDRLTELTRLTTLIRIGQDSESEMSWTESHRTGKKDEKTFRL